MAYSITHACAATALLALLTACGDEPRAVDDDDGGYTAPTLPDGGAGGTGGGGGATAESYVPEVAWTKPYDNGVALTASGPGSELYLQQANAWSLSRLRPDGTIDGEITYAPTGQVFQAGRHQVADDGTVVFVGGETLGMHTAKVAPDGTTLWTRVRGMGQLTFAETAAISPNGTVTVLGYQQNDTACVLTRYLSDGLELDEAWLQTLPMADQCRSLAADDQRLYIPARDRAVWGNGKLFIFDASTGELVAEPELPGAQGGFEVIETAVSLAPGGGAFVGYDSAAFGHEGFHMRLFDGEGTALWSEVHADRQGRVAARADNDLLISVTVPRRMAGIIQQGELVARFYQRGGASMTLAHELVVATVADAVVSRVVATPDGGFVIDWRDEVGHPTQQQHLVKLSLVAEEEGS